mgnify:CR=1 FL=1
MQHDLVQFAERKMPLFNLVISLWQHNLVLIETIGIGFTKSVFVHKHGMCELNVSQKEMDAIAERVQKLIKNGEPSFKVWYEKAKGLNKEADKLLDQYKGKSFNIDRKSYGPVLKHFKENFGYCTILPYWILYGIEKALEKGESEEIFAEVLSMYEELKGQTRYPQLGQMVIDRYFEEAAEIMDVDDEQASYLHPDELKRILEGEEDPVPPVELVKRMSWCALTLGKKPYDVKFSYEQKEFSNMESSHDLNVKEVKGTVAYKGVVRGTVKIVNTMDDLKKFNEGDVLISIQSSPSLMSGILRCSALVTDEGGLACHASIISRELKKPCVIGTKIATKVFKDGDIVEVDAEKGIVSIIG